ncbi:MAG: ATP-binding protein [Planctomycetota bacterium]
MKSNRDSLESSPNDSSNPFALALIVAVSSGFAIWLVAAVCAEPIELADFRVAASGLAMGIVAFGIWGATRQRQLRRAVRQLELERREAQQSLSAFSNFVGCTAKYSGDACFEALTRQLAEIFCARYAFIAVTIAEPTSKLQVLKMWDGCSFSSGQEYAIAETSCGEALRSQRCAYGHSLADHFPHDLLRSELGAQGCLLAAIPSHVGGPIGVIGVFHTDRCDDRLHLFGVLEILARLAAAELERFKNTRDLEESRRKAELAARTQNAFLANMSHEIRTPMTAILGYAEMLLDPYQAPTERIDCVQTILKSSERLLGLLDDLLDISKLDSGQLSVETKQCSPIGILEEVFSLMHARACAKNLKFENVYEFPLPSHIKTDPARLKQVLLNLVGNAVKFTDSGNVRVRLRLVPGAEPQLRFTVEDTGIGMEMDQVGELFKPFSRVDSSMTRRHGGPGLGLTICKNMCELLGGKISVESKPGGGSTFTFEIPTGSLDGVQMRQCVRSNDPGSPPRAQIPDEVKPVNISARILLAEDGPDNQRLVSYILRRAGCEIEIVDNGRKAVAEAMRALAAGQPYDVLLMDMQMPELDGYGATSLLRQSGYDRPIIALTAHALAEDRTKCLHAGCDEYLAKPVNKTLLLAAIRLAIDSYSPTPVAVPAESR